MCWENPFPTLELELIVYIFHNLIVTHTFSVSANSLNLETGVPKNTLIMLQFQFQSMELGSAVFGKSTSNFRIGIDSKYYTNLVAKHTLRMCAISLLDAFV